MTWGQFQNFNPFRLIEGPKRPEFKSFESRLKTFESWPKPDVQSPEKLAEAGFYYNNINDETYCFSCGGGLHNWKTDQEPWEDHAHYFSLCTFLNQNRDSDFIDAAVFYNRRIYKSEKNVSIFNECIILDSPHF